MKKKVAHIDFHYDMLNHEHGSAQKVIQSFLDNLEEFAAISISVSKNKNMKVEKKNVKYYVVAENHLKNRIFNKILGLDVFTYNKMIEIINHDKPEVLHFHNRHNLADKIYSYLVYKPKVVCHYHLNFKKPYIPECCDLILGVSKATQDHIVNVSNTKKRSSYVLNPISFDLEKCGNYLKQESKKIKLLFGGANNTNKGYNEIIQALYSLEKKNIEYILYICGNTEDINVDNNLNIEIQGFLSSKDFYKLMKECDILLFPSHFEPFGLTVLEGMYNKIKVLPSCCGGVVEILGESYPYYCNVKDSDSIVTNILKLSKLNKDDEEKLYSFYQERLSFFSAKNIAKTLEQKYKEII